MPNSPRKVKVFLSPEVRSQLEAIARQTSTGVARVRRAKILLMADENHPDGGYPDSEIAEEVGICERQVVRIRQKFVRQGLQATLTREVRSDAGTQRVLDGKAEAHLITLACSTPPEGCDHWTLQMLVTKLKQLKVVKSVCCETVRQRLKKTDSSLGKVSGFASRKRTGRDSSPGWKRSLTFTTNPTTRSTR
jgi:hypothetical protein